MPYMVGAADQIAADSAAEQPGGLPRSGSSSRLNAQAPEFVPRGPLSPAAAVVVPPPQVIRVFAAPPPPPRAAFFAAPPPRPFEYFAPVGGRGGFTTKEQQVPKPEPDVELIPPAAQAEPVVDGLEDEVVHKITKQVEYYFSDINLATTEHLMRFITKDPEGYVPISVIASFKKVKASVRNSMLAAALRASSKLVVSDDGKRVKRQEPFTESDLQELKSRIVVAENLPGDPSYQNLKRIFSAVGSVISIRTCYPQTPNGSGPATNRSAKLDMLFSNKLHAFVEYGTPEDAEKAIVALSDEENWRNGLRVRLLNTCLVKGAGKGKKEAYETDGNGEEDVSISNQSNDKQSEESSQLLDVLPEHLFDETFNEKEVPKRGRGRGRGGRGHGRGNHQYNNQHYLNHQPHYQNHQPHYNHHGNNHHGSNRGGAHPVGTPQHNLINKPEQQQQQLPIGASKLPPGPCMPDGTRGFTMGRGGKPQAVLPGNPDQARAEHLQNSHQEIGGSVLGNQTPSALFLEETMARTKVTSEEYRRIKKTREIKQRKNSLKAELDSDRNEEYDACAICDDGGSVTCCDGGCQRSFHLVDGKDDSDEEHADCREKLGLTLEQAKMIINTEEGFICKNCQYKQHQCFACGLLGSSDDTSSQPEVFQCSHDDCAHFYHPKCIAQLLYPNSEEATTFEVEVAAAREKFTCLMHECIVCKGVENKNDRSMQFAVCRRCPTVYHRKCLPSEIIFKSRKGPNGSLQRAWDDILPDRILIFCMKHKIIRKLRTPERNHIIFPEANELHMPKTLEGAPMEQDQPSSEKTKAPPPAASDQNQCSCSSPLSFAPSSLFMQPYPGSCGWLDLDD
ncbi:la-related protein 6B-like [Panicum miliaceum]|uniref:La-related protein 6B-like n=1 Tax=Panicum miliaceum TaxID=4540 RepID=A0A3L6T310_PANMI|nr:la-related protein 6B-like [Panicum miliaceum]